MAGITSDRWSCPNCDHVSLQGALSEAKWAQVLPGIQAAHVRLRHCRRTR